MKKPSFYILLPFTCQMTVAYLREFSIAFVCLHHVLVVMTMQNL